MLKKIFSKAHISPKLVGSKDEANSFETVKNDAIIARSRNLLRKLQLLIAKECDH